MFRDFERFLGKEYRDCEEKLSQKNKEVFDFYEELDYFMNTIKKHIQLKEDDFQGGTILGLFAKSLTTYKSIYLLYRHCFCNNSDELCRILFEELVNIAFCSLGKDETRRYLSLQYINQYKINNIINEKSNEKYLPKGFKEQAFKEQSYEDRKKDLFEKLNKLCGEEILDDKGKPIAIDLMNRIRKTKNKQLMHLYLTFYRIVSTAIHSSPEILRKSIDTYEDGLMKSFSWGILTEDCKIAPIFTSMYFMIMNMEKISQYFGYPNKKIIVKYWERLQVLGKKNDYFFEKL